MSAQVFTLPDLGEGLTEAEIIEWHVAVGDTVGIDQEVVTVETAKAAVEVPIPYAGAVAELHAAPGTVLAVGQPLITVTHEAAGSTTTNGAGEARPGGAGEARPGGAGEQYRTEERAGMRTPEDQDQEHPGEDQPERPLIGYGAGEGPARRAGGRRRRAAAAGAPGSDATVATNTPASSQAAGPQRAVRVISPLVRTLAQEWGIELTSVTPGPTGVIRRADLEAARRSQQESPLPATGAGAPATAPTATASPTAPTPTTSPTATTATGGRTARADHRIPIQGAQRIMVDRLSTSRREIPDATTWVDVDATRLMKAKDALKAARPDAGIGVLPLMARIVVAGLQRYPALNASVDLEAGEIVRHGSVNLGFAAQSPRGLVVPVVHGASEMTATELAAALRELTAKAREGTLTPAQMTGGTFTLNNYGVYGVDGSTPIINFPEAGMLGVGRIVDKPWVHQGRLKVRKVTQLGFTFDHRVCDGGTAGGFLRFVADCVEQPAVLLAEL